MFGPFPEFQLTAPFLAAIPISLTFLRCPFTLSQNPAVWPWFASRSFPPVFPLGLPPTITLWCPFPQPFLRNISKVLFLSFRFRSPRVTAALPLSGSSARLRFPQPVRVISSKFPPFHMSASCPFFCLSLVRPNRLFPIVSVPFSWCISYRAFPLHRLFAQSCYLVLSSFCHFPCPYHRDFSMNGDSPGPSPSSPL